MWILLSILFIMGFLHTACNISLLSEIRQRVIYSFIIFLAIFALFSWSKMLNIQQVDLFLADFSTLSNTCTFQVVEGLMMMFVSLLLIRSHYQTLSHSRWQKIAQYMALAPSGIFLVGLFLVQTYAFNVIEETAFYKIALGVTISGFLILLALSFVISSLVKTWESRVEIKIILSFLQILLAMFLPIIVTGNKLQQSHFVFDLSQSTLTIMMLLTVIFFGYYWRQYKIRRINS